LRHRNVLRPEAAWEKPGLLRCTSATLCAQNDTSVHPGQPGRRWDCVEVGGAMGGGSPLAYGAFWAAPDALDACVAAQFDCWTCR